MGIGRECEQCHKSIKVDSKKAEFLFQRGNGREAWVCGPRCLSAYNEGEDMASFSGGGHEVGERLDDGRYVLQVDDKGRIEVVGKTPPDGTVEDEPEDDVLECSDDGAQEAQEPAEEAETSQVVLDEEEAQETAPEPAKAATEPKKKRAYHRKPKEETKKTKTTKKTKVQKAPKAPAKKARTRMSWTPEVKAKYRAQIKAGKATYTSIARDLGLTVPAVWIPLNK